MRAAGSPCAGRARPRRRASSPCFLREGRTRDLEVFNLAIDSKLPGCDVVALKVEDVALIIGIVSLHRLEKQRDTRGSNSGASTTCKPKHVEHPGRTDCRAAWHPVRRPRVAPGPLLRSDRCRCQRERSSYKRGGSDDRPKLRWCGASHPLPLQLARAFWYFNSRTMATSAGMAALLDSALGRLHRGSSAPCVLGATEHRHRPLRNPAAP